MVGMQRMDSALMRMLDAQLITPQEAYFKSRNKDDFEHLVEDISINENDTDSETNHTLTTN